MESKGVRSRVLTPSKYPHATNLRDGENVDPNTISSSLKQSKSPVIKSVTKSHRSASKNPKPITSPSPRDKLRERRFVVAKRNSKKENVKPNITCKCQDALGGNSKKCLCAAYEILRVSQEDFFKQGSINDHKFDDSQALNADEEDNWQGELEKVDCSNGSFIQETALLPGDMGLKRRREKVMEEARRSVPETGSGKVRHLVNAFERLLTIPKSEDSDETEQDEKKKAIRWALPGLQQPDVPQTQVSWSSFCPSDYLVTSESLGLDSRVSSSLSSIQGSLISSRICGGSRRIRRNSSRSSGALGGSNWTKKRQLKMTRQKPFNLLTEQRGRCKEEELTKKLQEMKIEEEKLRIPMAQGLPWTTDEPEVAEKISLIEQYKMEKQKQQKLEEEEEIKRIRKELVPRAQPLPYFDRPFLPRRSAKQPTIPKEPKFHLASPHHHHHKRVKSCYACNNNNSM